MAVGSTLITSERESCFLAVVEKAFDVTGSTRPTPQARATFVAISAVLTGFDVIDLEGTGLVDAHCGLVCDVVGKDFFQRFMKTARKLLGETSKTAESSCSSELVGSEVFGPLVRHLIALWYLGQWDALPDDWFARNHLTPTTANVTHLPRGAFEEALAYRVADAHPPGAKPTGHGSWSAPPLTESKSVRPARTR